MSETTDNHHDTGDTITKRNPSFTDRLTLPLGRAETMTQILEDFIESLADGHDESCRGDALIHALQLELAEARRVIEKEDLQ